LSNKFNNAYGFWFDQVMAEYISKHKSETDTFEEYAKKNGFFITFNFDANAVASRKRSLHDSNQSTRSIEFWNVNHFYNLICNRLIGRKFLDEKNRDRLPRMIACADANGTRYWYAMGDVENVHLHTIWMLPSDLTEKFTSAIEEIQTEWEFSKFDFRQIDVRPMWSFVSDGLRPSVLSSYTSKFLDFNNEKLQVEEDIQIFPRSKNPSEKVRIITDEKNGV
jgi:hypothetical protein